MIDFSIYQTKFLEWEEKNFGEKAAGKNLRAALAGMTEEIGEFAHFVLKQSQQIREAAVLNNKEMADKLVDALMDNLVYMLGLLNNEEIQLRMTEIFECAMRAIAMRMVPLSDECLFEQNRVLVQSLGLIAGEIDKSPRRLGVIFRACTQIVRSSINACMYLDRNFTDEAKAVFDKVLQRDWNKDHVNGGDLDGQSQSNA